MLRFGTMERTDGINLRQRIEPLRLFNVLSTPLQGFFLGFICCTATKAAPSPELGHTGFGGAVRRHLLVAANAG